MQSISVDGILNASGVIEIPVASAAVVYTNSFKLDYASKFGLQYRATSDAAVSLKLELEEGNVLPATEGAADDNFVVPDGGMTVVADITTETVHIITLAPVVAKYGRFKITGGVGNTATTTLALWLAKTEDHG